MTTKTKLGARIKVTHRANPDKLVTHRSMRVQVDPQGSLGLTAPVGGPEEGLNVMVTVTLSELLAWLPEMVEQAKRHVAARAQTSLVYLLDDAGHLSETRLATRISDTTDDIMWGEQFLKNLPLK
ncbi:hypothetical protein [Paracoccus ravus]|uniref:hypothetical protein n=1 Tax=Paracoccus ravus TaxID=2447760 RepID=UPI00106E3985|nr:hypothetical protein [Paracoccus ravus]